MGVTEKVEPLIIPAINAQGVELYDLEYVKEGGNRILRLYIDKENGVDLNDCERVSHAAEAVLDAHDPIPDAYVLEVSSPGIERRLKKESHFMRYIGHKIHVRLYKAIDGQKNFTGTLTDYKNNTVFLTDENGEKREIEHKQISLCRLVIF